MPYVYFLSFLCCLALGADIYIKKIKAAISRLHFSYIIILNIKLDDQQFIIFGFDLQKMMAHLHF